MRLYSYSANQSTDKWWHMTHGSAPSASSEQWGNQEFTSGRQSTHIPFRPMQNSSYGVAGVEQLIQPVPHWRISVFCCCKQCYDEQDCRYGVFHFLQLIFWMEHQDPDWTPGVSVTTSTKKHLQRNIQNNAWPNLWQWWFSQVDT